MKKIITLCVHKSGIIKLYIPIFGSIIEEVGLLQIKINLNGGEGGGGRFS